MNNRKILTLITISTWFLSLRNRGFPKNFLPMFWQIYKRKLICLFPENLRINLKICLTPKRWYPENFWMKWRICLFDYFADCNKYRNNPDTLDRTSTPHRSWQRPKRIQTCFKVSQITNLRKNDYHLASGQFEVNSRFISFATVKSRNGPAVF